MESHLEVRVKRYRWTSFFIDAVRTSITHPALPDDARERNRHEIHGWLADDFGSANIEDKYARWLALEPPALCVPGEYHDLLREIEGAYIRGDFYPALTGACCLGERILNDLVMGLKKYQTASPRYKEVARKDSLDDWERAISILRDWRIIDEEVTQHFEELYKLRKTSVHYGDVARRAENAKKAIDALYAITRLLFGQGIKQFFMCEGEIHVKKEYENEPFTKEFLLPHCNKLGYRHTAEDRHGQAVLVDHDDYPSGQLTDDEFCEYRRAWRNGRVDRGLERSARSLLPPLRGENGEAQ